MLKTDKSRAAYYNYYTNKEWGRCIHLQLFDRCLCLGDRRDGCVHEEFLWNGKWTSVRRISDNYYIFAFDLS